MKKSIFLSCIAVLFAALSGQSQTDEKAIKNAINNFSKAGDKNDIKALEKYLDPNYQVVMNRLFGSKEVSIVKRADYLNKIKTKEWGGDTRKLSYANIVVNGATASAQVTFTGSKMTFISIITLVKK